MRGQRLAGLLCEWLGKEGGHQECVGRLMVVLGATIGLWDKINCIRHRASVGGKSAGR